tara:strand:+ start:39 stop:452 length:414 start_codon:yes stop_codon:yes gene_type:complete
MVSKFKAITLKDIWMEAKQDEYASGLDGNTYEARMVFGIKIVYDHDTDGVTIWNTSRGGDFYTEVIDLDPFFEGGWRYGVYQTALNNYRFKLDKVEEAMKKEVNGKRNPKQIKSLKNSRVRLLNKYNYISDKLNEIK